jgi:hypothetical protein
MPARDWRKLYQQYKGQWVALKDDEQTVVAHGPTLREVLEQATKGSPLGDFARCEQLS